MAIKLFAAQRRGFKVSCRKGLKVATVLVFLLLGVLILPAQARYIFTMERQIANITLLKDGSAHMEYYFTLLCSPKQDVLPIDVVEVHLPNALVPLSAIKADLEGNNLPDIRTAKSKFIQPGFEVHLEDYRIEPGFKRTLHVSFNAPQVILNLPKDKDKVKFEFLSTWFDRIYVLGSSYLEVNVLLPPDIKSAAEITWLHHKYTSAKKTAKGFLVTWQMFNTSAIEPHKFGVLFPKAAVEQSFDETSPQQTQSNQLGQTLLKFLIHPVTIFIAALIILILLRAQKKPESSCPEDPKNS